MAEIHIKETAQGFHVNSETEDVSPVAGMAIKVRFNSKDEVMRMVSFLMYGLITEYCISPMELLAATFAGLDTNGMEGGILSSENRAG